MATQYAESMMIRGIDGAMVKASDGALLTSPRSRFQQAVRTGAAFNWSSVTYDMAAADTVLGLENNDPNRLMYLWKMWVSSDTATVCRVFAASGITVAGTTAVTGYPLNRNFNTTALSTAYTKETGQDEAGSSWPNRLYMFNLLANTPHCINIHGSVCLPYDHMVGVDMSADAGGANVTVWGWYE